MARLDEGGYRLLMNYTLEDIKTSVNTAKITIDNFFNNI